MAERSASDGSETGFCEDMDRRQLAAWLKGKLPTSYSQTARDTICNTFKTEEICGESFLTLSKEDLKDMGLRTGPRNIILCLISKIKGEQECRVPQKRTAIDDCVAANTNKGPPLDTTKGKVITPTNGDLPGSALEKSVHDQSNGEIVPKGNMVSPAAEVNNLPQTEQQGNDAPPQTVNGDQPLKVPGEAEAAKADTNSGGTKTTTNESKQNDQAAKTDNDDLEYDLYSCWPRPSTQEAPLPGEGGAGGCAEDDRHFWDKELLSVYMNPKEIPKLTHYKWSYKGHLLSCQTVAEIAQEWNDAGEVPEMKYVPKFKFVYDAGQRDNCDIRVEFSETKRIETWVGTRAQTERNYNQPTMYLNLSQGNDRHKRHLILHEFGHALGLQHEHQSHNFPAQFIDLDKMNKELKNKGRMYKLDDWVMEGQYAVASKYDADSIMHYWIKEEWLKPGCRPGETPNPKLSKDDEAMLKKLHHRIRNLPDKISKTDKEWIGKKYKEIRERTTEQDEDTAPPGSAGSGGAPQPDDYEDKRKVLIAQFRQGEKNFRKINQATLNELVACRFPTKWDMFGLGVGLKQPELNTIGNQNNNKPSFDSRCFSAVFFKWEKTEFTPYTWEQVAKVMTSKGFGCEMPETRNLLADLTKK